MFSARSRRRLKQSSYLCEPMESRMLLASWSTFTAQINGNNIGVTNMMLLSDGTVMAHGVGQSNAWYRLTPLSLGGGLEPNYALGTWTQMPSMAVGRQFFPSAILPNGNAFILGGEFATDQNFSRTAELYNSLSNSWTPGINSAPPTKLGDVPIAVLSDGRVLVGDLQTPQTYFYNPATNVWSNGPSKIRNDQSDEETWVKLPDGSILTYDLFASAYGNQFVGERYIPVAGQMGSWVDASNLDPNNPPTQLGNQASIIAGTSAELGGGVLLPNGKVFITGNNNANGNTALYDTSTNTWSAGPTIQNSVGGGDLPMAMMPNGHVMICEWDINQPVPGATNTIKLWEYDPNNANVPYTLVQPPAPFADSNYPFMLMLPNGQLLMSNTGSTMYLYNPDDTTPAVQRPYISNITSVGFNIFEVTGNRLTGISEGASYGDDASMSTNYPIVRLQDNAGNVAYARSFDWSDTNVSQGNKTQTFRFSLPVNWNPDAYLVSVSASGVRSGAVLNVQMGAATTSSMELQPYIFDPARVAVLANGAIESTWALSSFASAIVSGNNAAETIVINADFGGRYVSVNGSGGDDVIRIEENGSSTVVNGDDGNDFIDFAYSSHNLGYISGPTTVNGGQGADQVFAYDMANGNPDLYQVNIFGVLRSNWGGITSQSGVEYMSLTTGSVANTVVIPSTVAGEQLFLYSAGGADTVLVGGTGSGAQGVQGNIEIHNVPNYSSLNIDDTNDPTARAIQIDNSGSLGVILGLTPGLITWANSDVSSMTLTTGKGADVMAIRAAGVPFTIQNAGGSDNISMGNGLNGMQSIIGAVVVHAYYGLGQRLTLDDSANTTGRNTTLTRSSLNGDYFVSGLAPGQITFRDFGSFIVQQGSGNDTFAAGGASQGGYDNDLPMTVNGNGGNDSYTLTVFNNWGELIYGDFTFPVKFDGGTGYNSLSIVDTARGNTSYQFFADRFYSREPNAFASGADFNYDGMSSIGVTCSNGNNPFAVYGTSSDIPAGSQITVVLNGGNDTATMYPHDASGNLTINGTIGIIGGTGTDTMTFDDTGAANPINYSFSNPFGAGTQDVFGIGAAGMGYTNDFEGATIKGGNGDDTFSINQYKAGTPLAIYGGGGNDTLNFGNSNLAANVTSIASFLFDGQGGSNTFNFLSVNDTTGSYARNVGSVSYFNGAGTYSITLSETNTQWMNIYPSSNAPTVSMVGVAAGTTTAVHFNTPVNLGLLQFGVGSKRVTGIQGAVIFDGGPNGSSISVSDGLETIGRTVHLTQNSLGAYPGDDLFPAGGSLTFANIKAGANPGLNLVLGSGADTVYAAPNLTGTVSITGGSPTTAPGDTLNLALAGANGYVLHGNAASGNVTSTNLKTLSYTGFETGPNVDDVAPAVIGANINVNGAAAAAPAFRASTFGPSSGPTLDVQFSENVAILLGTASIQLTNLSTGQIVPQAYLDMSYDPATHIAHVTFPGYPNGTMPDGNYHGSIVANSTEDLFGNTLAADAPLDFFILGGDANHDRQVDITDLYALASNWHGTGVLYSQGDFNYDGIVDAKDLGILSAHWQQTLPLPPAAAPVSQPKTPKRTATRMVSIVP